MAQFTAVDQRAAGMASMEGLTQSFSVTLSLTGVLAVPLCPQQPHLLPSPTQPAGPF